MKWLDLRADDLTRARALIRAFQGDGVLDELGFLALLSRFSDVFHPATSTLMTSSRYLYFVAGIYRQLERERIGSGAIKAAARKRQDELRQALSDHEDEGVIGREAGLDVKQLPATVYWSALRNLGMFTGGTSESGYQASFDELRRARHGYRDDDKVAHAVDAAPTWDVDLPPADFLDGKGQVTSGTAFALSRAEAQDLARRYQQRFPASLLTFMLKEQRAPEQFPWECAPVSVELRPYVDHARRLSLFARGVTLQYYQLVIERRDALGLTTPGDIVTPAFAAWWDEAWPALPSWRPDQLATLPDVATGLRHGRSADLPFIAAWLNRMRAASSPAGLLGDVTARQLVRERELAVKPLKSRLKHRHYLDQWRVSQIPDNPYQLDYRHPRGARFVREILAGLERG